MMQILRLHLWMICILALTLIQALAGRHGHNNQMPPEEYSCSSLIRQKLPQKVNHKRKSIPKNKKPDLTVIGRAEDKVREQENSPPSKKVRTESLKKQVESIKEQIEKARQEANDKRLRELHAEFENLNYSERAWDSYVRTHKLYQWRSQSSPKQTIGGYLFFPRDILDWEDSTSSPYFGYLAKRIDTIWSLAIGAKFQNPVSKLYLGKVLHEVYSPSLDQELPPLIDRLYREAFADLKQCEDNPDACYAIGVNRQGPYYITHKYFEENFFGDKAVPLHQKGGDIRNQFQALKAKQADKADFGDQQPTFKDLWDLGEKGYKPAYLEAARLKKEDSEYVKILKTIAQEKRYPPAWLLIASHYNLQKNTEKSRKYYLKAAEEGLAKGYIDLGISYAGDVSLPSSQFKKDLKTLPQEDIDQAIGYFTLAGEAKYQGGWKYLTHLYLDLLKARKQQGADSEELKNYYIKAYQALQKGMALGSAECYDVMFHCYSMQDFVSNVKAYGNPPNEHLRDDIEEFIYSKKSNE